MQDNKPYSVRAPILCHTDIALGSNAGGGAEKDGGGKSKRDIVQMNDEVPL